MDGLEALREALAMGADQAILLSDPAFEGVDSYGKAYILANALRKLGNYDLVLCGRQAGDVELGLVGPFLAEELKIPCVTLVATIEQAGDQLQMKRQVETGYEVLEVGRPSLATVTNDEANLPRYPSVRGIRMAMRKEIPVWKADDLEIDRARLGDSAAMIEMDELFIPERKQRCEIITGDSGEEKAQNLVRRLRELKLI
jgi:electron transfer flavoprotein beta subunit